MAVFNIGKQFSPDPAGRYYSDGNASGEQFREENLRRLIDELAPDELLEIVLDDGVEGYGSSFLSESFGGMVKYGYIQSDKLLKKIKFKYKDSDYKFYEDRALEYIKDSKFNSEKYVPTEKLKK